MTRVASVIVVLWASCAVGQGTVLSVRGGESAIRSSCIPVEYDCYKSGRFPMPGTTGATWRYPQSAFSAGCIILPASDRYADISFAGIGIGWAPNLAGGGTSEVAMAAFWPHAGGSAQAYEYSNVVTFTRTDAPGPIFADGVDVTEWLRSTLSDPRMSTNALALTLRTRTLGATEPAAIYYGRLDVVWKIGE